MKRLQIMIDEDLDDALSRQARRKQTSKAALIRRYVTEALCPLAPMEEDPIWELVGMVSGATNESGQVDNVVYERPGAQPPPQHQCE